MLRKLPNRISSLLREVRQTLGGTICVGLIAKPNEPVPSLRAEGRILIAQFPGPSLRFSPGFPISGLRPCRPSHPDEEEFEILADGQSSGRLDPRRGQGSGGAPAAGHTAGHLARRQGGFDSCRRNRRTPRDADALAHGEADIDRCAAEVRPGHQRPGKITILGCDHGTPPKELPRIQ